MWWINLIPDWYPPSKRTMAPVDNGSVRKESGHPHHRFNHGWFLDGWLWSDALKIDIEHGFNSGCKTSPLNDNPEWTYKKFERSLDQIPENGVCYDRLDHIDGWEPRVISLYFFPFVGVDYFWRRIIVSSILEHKEFNNNKRYTSEDVKIGRQWVDTFKTFCDLVLHNATPEESAAIKWPPNVIPAHWNQIEQHWPWVGSWPGIVVTIPKPSLNNRLIDDIIDYNFKPIWNPCRGSTHKFLGKCEHVPRALFLRWYVKPEIKDCARAYPPGSRGGKWRLYGNITKEKKQKIVELVNGTEFYLVNGEKHYAQFWKPTARQIAGSNRSRLMAQRTKEYVYEKVPHKWNPKYFSYQWTLINGLPRLSGMWTESPETFGLIKGGPRIEYPNSAYFDLHGMFERIPIELKPGDRLNYGPPLKHSAPKPGVLIGAPTHPIRCSEAICSGYMEYDKIHDSMVCDSCGLTDLVDTRRYDLDSKLLPDGWIPPTPIVLTLKGVVIFPDIWKSHGYWKSDMSSGFLNITVDEPYSDVGEPMDETDAREMSEATMIEEYEGSKYSFGLSHYVGRVYGGKIVLGNTHWAFIHTQFRRCRHDNIICKYPRGDKRNYRGSKDQEEQCKGCPNSFESSLMDRQAGRNVIPELSWPIQCILSFYIIPPIENPPIISDIKDDLTMYGTFTDEELAKCFQVLNENWDKTLPTTAKTVKKKRDQSPKLPWFPSHAYKIYAGTPIGNLLEAHEKAGRAALDSLFIYFLMWHFKKITCPPSEPTRDMMIEFFMVGPRRRRVVFPARDLAEYQFDLLVKYRIIKAVQRLTSKNNLYYATRKRPASIISPIYNKTEYYVSVNS